jgi:hypothetical protein
MLTYSSRVGITVVQHSYDRHQKTEVQEYIEKSGLLKEMPDLLCMDVIDENADEQRLLDGIKHLIEQKTT